MAAHTGQSTRSRRFIKIYLGTWGLLAVGALGYLALLTFPQKADAPAQAAVETAQADAGDPQSVDPKSVDPSPGDPETAPDARSDANALADVQGNGSEIRKDLARPQDAAGEPVPRERTAQARRAQRRTRQTRLPAPEKPAGDTAVGGIPQPTAVPGVTIAGGGAGTDVAGTAAVEADAPSGTPLPDGPAKTEAATPPPAGPSPSASPPFVPIETGSITPRTAPAAPEAETATPRIVKVAPVKVAPSSVPETVDVAPEPEPAPVSEPKTKTKTRLNPRQ